MSIWYDVTDLRSWNRPYLTGIQRTTVGILQGLLAHGVDTRLTVFDRRRRCFVEVGPDALPAVARDLLSGAAAADGGSPDADTRPPTRKRFRHRLRKAIFGTTAAAAELRVAFRTWRMASGELGSRSRRWLRARFSKRARRRPHSRWAHGLPASSTRPLPASAPTATSPFAAGDTLLSAGATWCVPGHAEAVASARSRGVKIMQLIYDLIPAVKPQWVNAELCRQFSHWTRSVLTGSDHVLTISEFTKGEILRYCAECGIAVPPLTVVRLGDVIDAADSSEPPPLPRFVPSRPFFVCVSTLDVRKNHRLLYDAWSQLAAADPDTCPDLLCIGTKHVLVDDLLHEIRHDRAVNGRIHLLDDVTDHELAWYYSACTATIYPSRYEGWGLPVAESLGRGKLCLASNATSIPEIDADLPAFFDPLDAHGLACLVRKAVDEPDWVSEREREIRDTFVATPWSHTAGQVLAAVRPATAAIRRAA